MSMTDPIADMLTRIRNAGGARFDKVDIPASRMKISLAKILKEEGFIKNYKVIKDSR
ncbi:MAG: 30S ribosomal protein S8, partial [Desulfobacca sp. RBG_16_58_9]